MLMRGLRRLPFGRMTHEWRPNVKRLRRGITFISRYSGFRMYAESKFLWHCLAATTKNIKTPSLWWLVDDQRDAELHNLFQDKMGRK